jgi:hypothetical protein
MTALLHDDDDDDDDVGGQKEMQESVQCKGKP